MIVYYVVLYLVKENSLVVDSSTTILLQTNLGVSVEEQVSLVLHLSRCLCQAVWILKWRVCCGHLGSKVFLMSLTGTTLAYCDGASGVKISTNWMVKVHVNGFFTC